MNSSINPILYCWRLGELRTAMVKIARRLLFQQTGEYWQIKHVNVVYIYLKRIFFGTGRDKSELLSPGLTTQPDIFIEHRVGWAN